jgi:hypothetical protein
MRLSRLSSHAWSDQTDTIPSSLYIKIFWEIEIMKTPPYWNTPTRSKSPGDPSAAPSMSAADFAPHDSEVTLEHDPCL